MCHTIVFAWRMTTQCQKFMVSFYNFQVHTMAATPAQWLILMFCDVSHTIIIFVTRECSFASDPITYYKWSSRGFHSMWLSFTLRFRYKGERPNLFTGDDFLYDTFYCVSAFAKFQLWKSGSRNLYYFHLDPEKPIRFSFANLIYKMSQRMGVTVDDLFDVRQDTGSKHLYGIHTLK